MISFKELVNAHTYKYLRISNYELTYSRHDVEGHQIKTRKHSQCVKEYRGRRDGSGIRSQERLHDCFRVLKDV